MIRSFNGDAQSFTAIIERLISQHLVPTSSRSLANAIVTTRANPTADTTFRRIIQQVLRIHVIADVANIARSYVTVKTSRLSLMEPLKMSGH
jgi:hypothetical protein